MKDWRHFLVLTLIMAVGLFLFLHFSYNRSFQIGLVAALGVIYVIWGVAHHSLKKNFHLRILFEYLAVAILASTMVIFLLLRT